jgi:predicted ArsR family transcriptional regulator
LDELTERVSPETLNEIARAVGHRLAETYPRIAPGKPKERIEQALSLLRELGGFCLSDGGNGTVLLRCIDCPLAIAVEGHPEACQLVETVLTDVLGVAVHQRCQQEPTPRCFFEIETGAA